MLGGSFTTLFTVYREIILDMGGRQVIKSLTLI